jgi:arylsulfatase A-like enzyme
MSDSLRKDHLGCYGNRWIKTPNIDELAPSSAVFDYAYAEGLATIPVRISLFTGRYTLPYRGWEPLEKNDMPLAEFLWNKGYSSALISDTYHMHEPKMGFGRGFDYVEWIRGGEYDPYIINPNVITNIDKYSDKNEKGKGFQQHLRNIASWKDEEDSFVAQIVNTGISWLEKKFSQGRKDNLFLWLDCYEPHEPHNPPSPYNDIYKVPEYNGPPIICPPVGTASFLNLVELRHLRAQYAGQISLVDKWVGVFLKKMDELGLWDNTLLIFLADHGQPLGEHEIIRKAAAWPYEEVAHFPLIIRFPDKFGIGGKRIDSFVGMPDIFPTILDFLQLKGPKTIQGKSLLKKILNEDISPPFGLSGYYDTAWSIRDREWSFYHWLKPVLSNRRSNSSTSHYHYKKDELFRLEKNFVPPQPKEYNPSVDLAEKDNIIEKEPEISKKLEIKLRRFMDKMVYASV